MSLNDAEEESEAYRGQPPRVGNKSDCKSMIELLDINFSKCIS